MRLAPDEDYIITTMRQAFGVRAGKNDVEYVRTDGKNFVMAVDTITASADIPKGMRPYDAARKSVVACVSDFAAKAARPRFGIVSVTVPASYPKKPIKDVARGIADAAKKFGIKILGGDVSFGEFSISVCLFGESATRPVGRGGACIGDGIFVTGKFGYSAAGLHIVMTGKKPGTAFETRAKKAFCTPDAKLKFGVAAGKHFSSSVDSSDGLAESLHILSKESRTQLLVEKLPIPVGLDGFAKRCHLKPENLLMYGGEEYELVFTAPRKKWPLIRGLAVKYRTPLTMVGTVGKGTGVCLVRGSKLERILQRRRKS